MKRIKISKLGNIYIPIDIKPFDELTLASVKFKVDTGADITTISKKDLIYLGYDMNWIKQNMISFNSEVLTTATGDVVNNAGYTQLPLINILGYECINWPFRIVMDEKKDFRNLIGLDLLTYFNCNIDYDEDIFTISTVKFSKQRYQFLLGQEIHELSL